MNPHVGQGVQRGILSDAQVEQIFLGKTAPELESMIDGVHPTQGSFDLLVSENFGGPPKLGETWFQWVSAKDNSKFATKPAQGAWPG